MAELYQMSKIYIIVKKNQTRGHKGFYSGHLCKILHFCSGEVWNRMQPRRYCLTTWGVGRNCCRCYVTVAITHVCTSIYIHFTCRFVVFSHEPPFISIFFGVPATLFEIYSLTSTSLSESQLSNPRQVCNEGESPALVLFSFPIPSSEQNIR